MRNGTEHGFTGGETHNNESTMARRDREIIIRFGSEAHEALRHARDNLLTEHNQLILEGIMHKARTLSIWNRSDRDLLAGESKHFRDMYERSQKCRPDSP